MNTMTRVQILDEADRVSRSDNALLYVTILFSAIQGQTGLFRKKKTQNSNTQEAEEVGLIQPFQNVANKGEPLYESSW